MDYTELHCHSFYSFLNGTSSPAELAERASSLRLKALALTDDNGLYGVIPFMKKAQEIGLPFIIGSLITVERAQQNSCTDDKILLLCQDMKGYQNLSELITRARHTSPKSTVRATLDQVNELSDGLICLIGKESNVGTFLENDQIETARARLDIYRQMFTSNRLYIELINHLEPGDVRLCKKLCQLALEFSLRYVATNGVRYVSRSEARLHDVLRCIACGVALDDSDKIRTVNHQRYLKSSQEMETLFSEIPSAIASTQLISEQCNVELDFAQHRFPDFATPEGYNADSYLMMLCKKSMAEKYGSMIAEPRRRLREELSLIKRLGLSGYFLVVWDIVKFARSKGIPAQGRGSAANSLVTYLLDITPVDPIAHQLFFGRFLNEEKTTIPDIDIDFAASRNSHLADRDDVIEYVDRKYGSEHVALACCFITFRARSAIREVGKAFGLPAELLHKMAKLTDSKNVESAFSKINQLKEFSYYTKQLKWKHFRAQVEAIIGLPRHVSMHPGGVLITPCKLSKLVPLEPTRIDGRRICQWDKDMVEDAGLIKVDLLGLGMLAVVRECLILIAQTYNVKLNLADITTDDPCVYDMLERADTVGVFQVESRVQVQVLPRTKPRNLSELAAQVAIIRPGPVQGNMVEPYIRRKQKLEPIRYPHPLLEPILKETLGVVLFQEQILQVACAIASYTPSQAENLRRDLDKKHSKKAIQKMQADFVAGAVRSGVLQRDAIKIFDSIKGFSAYGFCKSHALSFAHLAYRSAWLKHYYPACYLAALLNNQPAGFYPQGVLINEAKRHGIRILNTDVNLSGVRCYVETDAKKEGVRLSLTCVKGMSLAKAESVVAAREGGFVSLKDFVHGTKLDYASVENLIGAGAFDGFKLSRGELLWQLCILDRWRDNNLLMDPDITPPPLPKLGSWSQLEWEYSTRGFSTHTHPMELLRVRLNSEIRRKDALENLTNGARVSIAGLIVCIQRPQSAKGVAFLLLEDESGLINVVISPQVFEQYRSIFKLSPFVVVCGKLQRSGELISVQAKSFEKFVFEW